ncbi:hypothetical protein V500_08209 [Pseudogymnoascus sp. VKM F-4518 (FW-2643)]|nr:hypothetical protein V500_08209 [Pseudogymnoascus sp. VKM F-4518 (FW-2643)]
MKGMPPIEILTASAHTLRNVNLNEGSFYLADSTEAYIALTPVPAYQLSTSDFTVEAWAKAYSGGPVMGILATENSLGFYLLLNAESIEFNTQEGTSYAKGFVLGVSPGGADVECSAHGGAVVEQYEVQAAGGKSKGPVDWVLVWHFWEHASLLGD